jgi:hypothetical protein
VIAQAITKRDHKTTHCQMIDILKIDILVKFMHANFLNATYFVCQPLRNDEE